MNYPFYYSVIEAGYEGNQYVADFTDGPEGDIWFDVAVTLVGVGFNGRLTPFGTYGWGYVPDNNGAPTFVGPILQRRHHFNRV